MSRAAQALAFAVAFASIVGPAGAEEPARATTEEIAAAQSILAAWTAAFQAGDYRAQWMLTDKRIRHWHDKKRWKGWMEKAAKRNGGLVSYAIDAAAPARAADLPCTEHGHCFRDGVKYVLVTVRSDYEIAKPPQPEFVVMAESDEGWRFGGGSFLNRPLGETAVILTVQDERRYKPAISINR